MIRHLAIVREAASRIADAAVEAADAFRQGRVEQEPALTDRMLGRIEQIMDGFESRGIRWTAKTLTDRGPGAQERLYGADFVGVLQVSLPSYAVKKGFLAEAKLIDPTATMPAHEHVRCRGDDKDSAMTIRELPVAWPDTGSKP